MVLRAPVYSVVVTIFTGGYIESEVNIPENGLFEAPLKNREL